MTSEAKGPLADAYLDRIGLERPGAPTLDVLRRLHAAHVATIPFENLDILLGRGISLDPEDLRAKLVEGRRGGYCFEQNTLFQHVLRDLGFAVTPLEARVRIGATSLLPRTHMVLAVRIDEQDWLADVGFGADGLLEPVLLPPARAVDLHETADFRVASEGDLRVLQKRTPDGWVDLYAFLLQGVHPVDFEVGNWYTSTHPTSAFLRRLTAQRTTPEVRYLLRYPLYSEIRGFDVQSREITRGELAPLLRETFLIDIPLDVRIELIDGPAPAVID